MSTYHSPLNVPRPLTVNGFPMTPSLRVIAGLGAAPRTSGYHDPMHVPSVLSVGADPTGIGGAVAGFGNQVGSGVSNVMMITVIAAIGYWIYKKESKR